MYKTLTTIGLVSLLSLSGLAHSQGQFLFKTIDWLDLIPEEDLRLLESIPQVDHDSLGDTTAEEELPSPSLRPSDSLTDQISQQMTSAIEAAADQNTTGERTWRDALVSTQVRPEFNNRPVRLPGYVVPLSYNDKQEVTEFFLVPYFGACIHVPPPPPNQILYVSYPKGFALPDLYTPFWVEGTLKIATHEHELGIASYSMTNPGLHEYTEEDAAAL